MLSPLGVSIGPLGFLRGQGIQGIKDWDVRMYLGLKGWKGLGVLSLGSHCGSYSS